MNAIAKIETQSPLPPATSGEVVSFSTSVGIFSSAEKFEFMQRAARVFAESDLVPKHMQGKLSNCLIALNIAERLREDPLVIIQNIMVVNGSPGWKTAYLIGRANRSGVFSGRITWKSEGQGESLRVTASAVLADTGEVVSQWVDMAMAKAEGWTRNAKYQSMPEIMLQYRSAAFLIRLYCPEVMFGYQTEEEIETMAPMRDITPPAPAQKPVEAQPIQPSNPALTPPAPPKRAPKAEKVAEPAVVDRGNETGAAPSAPALPEEDRPAEPSKAAAVDASGSNPNDDFPGDRQVPKAAEPEPAQSAELAALLATAQKKIVRGKKGLNLWVGGLEEHEKALIKPHYGELLRQAALNDVGREEQPPAPPARTPEPAAEEDALEPGEEASVKRAEEEGAKAAAVGMAPRHNPYLNREGFEEESRAWAAAYTAAKQGGAS